MIPCDLKKLPVFGSLESNFISRIHMAILFGNNGEQALVATKDRMVYGIRSISSRCDHGSIDKSISSPQKIDALCGKHIKTFAKSQSFILALTEEGEVYSWTQTSRDKVLFPNYDTKCYRMKIIHISCGYSFTVVVTDNGEVHSWGSNTNGQLGIGNYIIKDYDKCKITGLSGVVIEKVVCGYAHTLALSSKGCLYVWGSNNHGQLGISIQQTKSIDRTASLREPQKLEVPKMGRVYDIAACWCQDISVAMGEANRIFIWGYCLNKDIEVPTLTPLRCLHDSFAFYKSRINICHLLIVNDEKETNVMGGMEEAFDDPSTSDLIIQVHGKPIHVHKVVLKVRSRYFRTMFQEQWTENSQSVIEHEQFSYDVYKSFLKYLYTNEVDLCQEDVL
ncbi:RCC1 and BTB domain-containing protein 1-like, partial [Ceratina calcarata]|uniref:RCC1 and BTB domain-containing protein 1-like n=1 Tax=Ceratina calcarata TaxID=156304 RepID=A0AAJ7S4T3_9HYME